MIIKHIIVSTSNAWTVPHPNIFWIKCPANAFPSDFYITNQTLLGSYLTIKKLINLSGCLWQKNYESFPAKNDAVKFKDQEIL